MSAADTKALTAHGDDFHGEATHQDGVLTMRLVGVADYGAVDVLELFLDDVHAECQRAGVKHVSVDLLRLEFMNSSCFKCLVSWITILQETPRASQYQVTFVSNPQLHWQKRSLHSLRCFAEDLITVHQGGSPGSPGSSST
ncbi:MAG: hypothetical protein ACKV2T_37175 [Kofleriaceae bacterium]